MQTIQQFGRVNESFEETKDYLKLQFSTNVAERQKRWRNYGLSADFLGDYFANFFPGGDCVEGSMSQRSVVKSTVSFVANELLENAIKYTDPRVEEPISIALYLHNDHIVFNSINYANEAAITGLTAFVSKILNAENLDELLAEQLEATARGSGHSHLGLLTMMCDYGVEFGWQFQPSSIPQITQVNVVAYLAV